MGDDGLKEGESGTPIRKPAWFSRGRLAVGEPASSVLEIIARENLHTVCSSAACPNKGACFAGGTATFLILGDICTRSCGFCNITAGRPLPPDPGEPSRVARAARSLGLKYVVVTSVTRDDLPDGGSSVFARTIEAVRAELPGTRVEVLVPDFSGRRQDLETVLRARPDVFNHNLETVERLTPAVRSGADYQRSLDLLSAASSISPATPSKSGLMVGLGESVEELAGCFADLAGAGVRRLTIGQYLQPSRRHLPVRRYYSPEEFDELAERARAAGIRSVLSGPLVRSSYMAGTMDGSGSQG